MVQKLQINTFFFSRKCLEVYKDCNFKLKLIKKTENREYPGFILDQKASATDESLIHDTLEEGPSFYSEKLCDIKEKWCKIGF